MQIHNSTDPGRGRDQYFANGKRFGDSGSLPRHGAMLRSMRKELIKLALSVAAMLAGLALLGVFGRGALANVGVGVFLIGSVALLYAVRDTICALLRRRGREPDPGRVFTHLCAGLMFLLGLGMFTEPRLAGPWRWVMLFMLPAMYYLLSYVLDWMGGLGTKHGRGVVKRRRPRREKQSP